MFSRLIVASSCCFCIPLSVAAAPLTDTQYNALKAAYDSGNAFVIEATKQAIIAENSAADVKTALALLKNPPPPPPVPEKAILDLSAWEGEVSFGLELRSGNTERTTYSGGLKLARDEEAWAATFSFNGRMTEESKVRTEENYESRLEGRYKLGDRSFVVANLDWVEDPFDSYSTRFSETLGYGISAIKNDRMQLDIKGSVGLRHARPNRDGANFKHEVVVQPAVGFEWYLSDGVVFTERLASTIGQNFVLTTSESAIKTKMFEDLYLKFAFEIEHNSVGEPGREQTDTETTVNVVYGF